MSKESDERSILERIYNAICDDININLDRIGGVNEVLRYCEKKVKKAISSFNDKLDQEQIRDMKMSFAWYSACKKHLGRNSLNENLRNMAEHLKQELIGLDMKMLEEYKERNSNLEIFNLNQFFSLKQNRTNLLSGFINDAFDSYINTGGVRTMGKKAIKYCKTKNGKQYHTYDCKYLKGHKYKLYEMNDRLIELTKVTPCKCVLQKIGATISDEDNIAKTFVPRNNVLTVFIDESIKANMFWYYNKAIARDICSYSYVICEGYLSSEKEIREKNILFKDVINCKKISKTSELTQNAIKHVLINILYDHHFNGNVVVYVDNESVVRSFESWCSSRAEGEMLLNSFENITLVNIPREENTVADSYIRNRVVFDMSLGDFKCALKKMGVDVVKSHSGKNVKIMPHISRL